MEQRRHSTEREQETIRILQTRLRLRPESSGLTRKREAGIPRQKSPESYQQGSKEEIRGVYVISVAARILEMHPQTLRKYERLGLVRPARTVGMLRLYSEEDIEKIKLIKYLEENLGLNLAGVEWALNLFTLLIDMRQRLGLANGVNSLQRALQHEMDRLFQALNLPLER